jgi:3-hydroxybutyrate dehydrogenase
MPPPALGSAAWTELAGRTALVTGRRRGSVRRARSGWAADGARVVLLDRDERVADAAVKLGGEAVIAGPHRPRAVVGLDLAADIVVNCAGVQHVAPIEEFPPDSSTGCSR